MTEFRESRAIVNAEQIQMLIGLARAGETWQVAAVTRSATSDLQAAYQILTAEGHNVSKSSLLVFTAKLCNQLAMEGHFEKCVGCCP